MSQDSTKDALTRFFQKDAKQLKRSQKPKKKNQRPEMELVQKPCKKWFRANGWSMFIIDAKAKWSTEAQAYVACDEVQAGFSDSVGCTPDGTAAFVEFKAPGRRATLKPHQREFITDKIGKGCFAVCIDSVEELAGIYSAFMRSRNHSRELAINLLMHHLPGADEPRPGHGEIESLFE